MIPLILGAAAFGMGAASSILGHKAQNDAAEDNARAARAAFAETQRALALRAGQERAVASQSILSADRERRMADAMTRVSAGEAGVAGASVDALLTDIVRASAEANSVIQQNLKGTLNQIHAEMGSAQATMQSRINSTPSANPFLTALEIGSSALSFGQQLYAGRKP